MPTHYEVLGVPADASPAALRAAYLAKARALHPDRQIGRSDAEVARAQRAMQDVNRAWTVLGDPRRRREYDLTLTAPSGLARPPATARPAARPPSRPPVVLEEVDHGGAALPFLVRAGPLVLLLGVLAAVFVVTAYAAGNRSVDTPGQEPLDAETPAVGTCLDVLPLELRTVPCDAPGASRIASVIEPGESCPGGSVPVWWEEDELLCVRPPS